MLYLTSKPLALQSGEYAVSQITSDELAKMVRDAASSGLLESRIHFASSAAALRALAAVDVRTTSKEGDPYLTNNDTVVEVRLKPTTPKGQRVGLADLEFWKINFKANGAWPALVDD